jgi:hypothetical protein
MGGPGSGRRARPVGYRRHDSHGYVQVKAPSHPRAYLGFVREHVLVAETMIGRPLRDDECVHHINGKRDDNRPENLQVLTQAEHARLHGLGTEVRSAREKGGAR